MFRWLLLASLAVATPASAKWQSVAQVAVTGTTDFVGPGDIVANATFWAGLRGYSAAVASTGTQKAINVRRQSDNTTSDILINTGGELNTASAIAFAGTDATCQGTIAGTTMALTACSSTPTANDPVAGAGITQPAYILSCGAFVAGAGSCTLNTAQTVSVAETMVMQVALFVTKLYDQSGGGNDFPQATTAQQALFLADCGGVLPCLVFNGSNSDGYQATVTGANRSGSYLFYANRTPTSNSTQAVISTPGAISGFGATNTALLFYNSNITLGSVADASWHAVQAISNNASSFICADGACGTTGTTGAANADNSLGIGVVPSFNNQFFTGYWRESGQWSNTFMTVPQTTSECHNMAAAWGSIAC